MPYTEQMDKKSTTVTMTLIINNILLVAHILQYVRSDLYWKPLVYIALCILYNVMVLIFDDRYMSEFFMVAGIVYIVGSRFDCPGPYLLVATGIYLKPSRRIIYTLIYTAAWICMMVVYQDSFTHVIIHGCIITMIIIGEMQIEKGKKQIKPLDLTEDELICIRQIADGAEVKEIREYSENTVYKKLREARSRNNIDTNCELISRYKDTI